MGATGAQVCTGVNTLALALQVVVVQRFPALAVEAVQLATGTLLVLLVPQVVVVKLLPDVGGEAVQVCTATVLVATLQVMLPPATQLSTATAIDLELQVVF